MQSEPGSEPEGKYHGADLAQAISGRRASRYRRHPSTHRWSSYWKKALRSSPTARRSSAWTSRSATATSTKCRQPSAPICRARAAKGRPRRADDAERAAIPGLDRRRAARRLRGGETSTRSTPRANSSITLKDSGAEAIVVLENFATTVQQVVARTAVKHVIVGSMGDLLGFKGVIVNLVIRKVKKMVPAWSIPGAISFNDRSPPAAA